MRLERIPSSIVLHKRVDGIDTRLASIRQPLSHTPLSNELGLFQFGQYNKAPPNEKFAFVRVQEMWQEDISESEASDSSDSESSDNDDEDDSDGNDDNKATAELETEGSVEVVAPTGKKRNKAIVRKPKQQQQSRKVAVRKRGWSSEPQPTRASKRAHKVPERFRDKQEAKEPVELTATGPTLRGLWKRIQLSKDKLFFIKRQLYGEQSARWYLVQVDLDETDPHAAKQVGRYHCKWYVRHVDDSREMATRNARFWPEIHVIRDGVLAEMILVRPNKVATFLRDKGRQKYVWYQDEVSLAEDQLVGPFDFKSGTQDQPRQNRVDSAQWDELLKFSETVDTSMVDVVDPLK